MDTDIKKQPVSVAQDNAPREAPVAQSAPTSGQVLDVGVPQKNEYSTTSTGQEATVEQASANVGAAAVQIEPGTTPQASVQTVPQDKKVEVPQPVKQADKPAPAKLKQPSTLPIAAMVGAVIIFTALAVVTYMVYSKGQ
ncbi:hypothetical protein IPL85_01675 [Candidatus Saccharibacteria bacterium]|nr:MAG: hypothetical protein IPL85_01675 [Candidatus Saccharibacteria bacterium]